MHTVRETLLSILAQSYTRLEVHVSDNASSDDTLQVVESIHDPRLFIHRQTENIGAEGNFSQCIQLARGKYTALFHADDVYEPDMVARQVAFLESHAEVGAAFCQARIIDENGVISGVIGKAPQGGQEDTLYDFPALFKAVLQHHNFLVCPSAMVRTELYQNEIRVWGNPRFRSSSDLDTWLRLARRQPIAVIAAPLMRYRISSSQFSHGVRNQTTRADFFLVMDDYLARPEVQALIGPRDLAHYAAQERRQTLTRAMNLALLGQAAEARALFAGFFGRQALATALQSRKGLLTLLAAVVLRALLVFGAAAWSLKLIRILKTRSRS
jgi:glycosyltransferase involved in cell wall biosynthesis